MVLHEAIRKISLAAERKGAARRAKASQNDMIQPSPLKTTLIHIVLDSSCLLLSIVAALLARLLAGGSIRFSTYLPLLLIWPLLLFYFFSVRLYPAILLPPQEEFRKCAQGATFAFAFMWIILFFLRPLPDFSRAALLGAWILTCVSIPFGRHILKKKCASRPWWGEGILICGQMEKAAELFSLLASHPELGLKPKAIVPYPDAATPGLNLPLKNLSTIRPPVNDDPLPASALILIDKKSEENQHALMRLSRHFRRALFVLPDFSPLGLWVSGTDVAGIFALEVNQKLLAPWRQKVKRLIDLGAIICAAPLFMPLMALLAFLIWREDGGPVFYSQTRIGKGGRPFRMWKFRTMIPNADKRLAEFLEADPRLKEEWTQTQKLRRDPRITGVGHFLRRTSLDELPQLWNVFEGSMSLVGPRPIVKSEIEKYGEVFDLYARVRPGMTGFWQVSGRSSLSYTTRIQLDSYYIRNWSVWFDLYIICATPGALLKISDAC